MNWTNVRCLPGRIWRGGFNDFVTLTIILFLTFALITLAQRYGGIIMPAAAAEWCREEIISKHQNYLTALTAFSEKSQRKLMREAQQRLERILDEC